jgi:hypothetical protein
MLLEYVMCDCIHNNLDVSNEADHVSVVHAISQVCKLDSSPGV